LPGEAPIATESVRRIDDLFAIERHINGKSQTAGGPDARRRPGLGAVGRFDA
jgi:hypothetical protein